MNVFKLFTIISSGLVSCSGTVALMGWQEIYHQPTGALIRARSANWEQITKAANDKVFDLKVETGALQIP